MKKVFARASQNYKEIGDNVNLDLLTISYQLCVSYYPRRGEAG